jgi:Leucine-rich repeat (LRR) protein
MGIGEDEACTLAKKTVDTRAQQGIDLSVDRLRGPIQGFRPMFYHRNGVSVASGIQGLRKLCNSPELLPLTTAIELSNVRLENMPDEIFSAVHLESLTIIETTLRSISPRIALNSGLQELVVRSNRLVTLPPEVAQLARLEVLDLADNKISILPPSLTMIASLRKLDFSENQVKTIPADLCKLESLCDLIANDNLLAELPDCIARMPHLNMLELSKNNLRDLPRLSPSFGALRHLFVENNPLSTTCLQWLQDKPYYK